MRMTRYQYKIQTVYQHLFTDEYDIISINANSEELAESVLSRMLSERDDCYSSDSSYQTYQFELVNIFH